MSERQLAVQIARCSELQLALNDKTHPCRDVVMEQSELADRHIPEPWFGNLAEAQILFVSSNPSIDTNSGETCENYPRQSWADDEIADWFTRRVDQDWDLVPVSFKHSTHKSFLWRCIDGKYRGASSSGRSPQPTWNRTQKMAEEILGDIASPVRNWALTEVVHCKSQMAAGVVGAVGVCSTKWMGPIMKTAASANVVVLCGREVRDGFAKSYLRSDAQFGREVDGNSSAQQRT
ncbi:MAG: hypothetical protein EBU84_18800, partial [Actinobacteria bacterium]|nr:hypothetical protein [Actinomycetota bacterium]